MSQDCEITASFLSTVVDLPDREVFPEIDATIAVDPEANYGFVPGSVRFTPSTGDDANLPAPLPENINPSSSLLEYSVQLENPGDTATITITYDEPIGLGDRPMKFGPETPGAEPTWFEIPRDMFTYGEDGLSIELTITDGELGDSDGERNGIIEDPLLMTKLGDGVTIIQTDEVGEGFLNTINTNLIEIVGGESDFLLLIIYPDNYLRSTGFLQPLPETLYGFSGCSPGLVDNEKRYVLHWTPFAAVLGLNYNEGSTQCTIIANHPIQHQVSIENVSGITFEPQSRTVHRNLFAAFNISIPEGVIVDSISGCEGATLNDAQTLVSIPNVLADCTLSPVVRQYTVSATTDSNGDVVGPSSREVNSGSTTTFEFEPNSGYEVSTISGCGEGSRNGNSYTTGVINADCTVTASFQLITYTVTPAAGEGGTISQGPQTGVPGSRFNLTETPNTS